MTGRLYWKRGDVQRTIVLPVHWDNIDYCDAIEVHLVLKGIEMASVEREDSIVAVIYGTPEGFCNPGLPNRQSFSTNCPIQRDGTRETSSKRTAIRIEQSRGYLVGRCEDRR